MFLRNKRIFISVTVLLVSALVFTYTISRKPVDFTRQVKPIINKNCISCHGGVKQKAGFSLLFREEALANTESGRPAIIPGDANNSEIIRRITVSDPEERMPYKHEPLSNEEVDIFTRWVNEGAHWGEHWAYVPVKKTEVPKLKSFFNMFTRNSNWALNPIDYFIEQKVEENDLKPSPEADRSTLLRRVSMDLTGLPAAQHLADKFLNGSSDHAYEDLVDSLLTSPHFGEKWTAMWMDLARYADSRGYENDQGRNIWKYRDWLIKSFNEDKPYDQFLTEQIAGDLLKNATEEQLIATAFHRNTLTNDEGGTDNEEFRISAVVDRVNTTWDALMGTTFACTQCHSHPYDPFKHEEYYKFMAFFNDTRDEDTHEDYPVLRHYNDTMQKQLAKVVDWYAQNSSQQKAKETETFLKTLQPSYNPMNCDSFRNGGGHSWWLVFRDSASCRLKNVYLNNSSKLIFKYSEFFGDGLWTIRIDSAKGNVIASIPLSKTINGTAWGTVWDYAEVNIEPVAGMHDLYFSYTNPHLKKSEETGARFEWFHFTDPFPGVGKAGYSEIKNEYWNLLRANPVTTPIMMENPSYMHRETFVFERGNWLVKGDQVKPGTPASLNTFPDNAPRNREGLAMWLTSKQNPLTSRSLVNHVWEQLFGKGLAETIEDLGSQGIPPTHAELLDWLSYQFMNDYKWSIKTLIRNIVLSATYRQDSKISEEALQKDPYNKLYARSSRIRLSAEQIRDQALCISGILSSKLYGPSVYPYQPKGLWIFSINDNLEWEKSPGEDQYRRAIYTYWKRSSPYPSMITFDGVARNACTSRRIRTNTPLQALTTLNDSAYIDMARHFAYRLQKEAGDNIKEQIKKGYQLATYNSIDNNSLDELENLYQISYDRFKNDPDKTCRMVGEMNEHSNPETAALIVVTNAILNLDEVVTRN